MPKMAGIEVLQQIKADKNLELIPIVVLTSSRESRDLEECYKLGVNSYVVKPVRFTEFIEAVRQIGVYWALINEGPPDSVKSKCCYRTIAAERNDKR
jgi:CheY-like chemotaxis protein